MDPYYHGAKPVDDAITSHTTSSAETAKFLTVCEDSFRQRKELTPTAFSFDDWKVCVSMAIQVGLADLHDRNIAQEISVGLDRDGWNCIIFVQVGRDGRIKQLALFPNKPFLRNNSGRNLVERRLRNQAIGPKAGIGRLEHLEHVDIGGVDTPPDYVLDVLLSFDFCRAEHLQSLSLNCSPLHQNHVETLFFEVLPRFPNVQTLTMKFRTTAETPISFEAIADRIRRDKSCVVSKTLRSVSFPNVIVYESTIDVIRFLLKYFPTIEDVDVPSHPTILALNDLEYPLLKNMVGRRIFKGNGCPPLSIWPTVLHKAQVKIDKAVSRVAVNPESEESMKATGIYYLLRNGPALIGRRDLVCSKPNEGLETANKLPGASKYKMRRIS